MKGGTLRLAPAAESRVPSPCTNVCRIDPASGWCEGCLRTIEEIAAWGSLGDDAKRVVWELLPLRRQTLADMRDAT
jgi:uncharacterized protein